MEWDRFFDDLEDQLAAEWEAERVALDSETERLRLSRMVFRERLSGLIGRDTSSPAPGLDLSDGTVLSAEVTGVGADWVAVQSVQRAGRGVLIPLNAIVQLALSQSDVLRSARPAPATAVLSAKITFGFVLRDLVRRRAAVSIHLMDGRALTGTIDRAGADHLDFALHDLGAPRRASAVSGYRTVPFGSISWVTMPSPPPLLG